MCSRGRKDVHTHTHTQQHRVQSYSYMIWGSDSHTNTAFISYFCITNYYRISNPKTTLFCYRTILGDQAYGVCQLDLLLRISRDQNHGAANRTSFPSGGSGKNQAHSGCGKSSICCSCGVVVLISLTCGPVYI